MEEHYVSSMPTDLCLLCAQQFAKFGAAILFEDSGYVVRLDSSQLQKLREFIFQHPVLLRLKVESNVYTVDQRYDQQGFSGSTSSIFPADSAHSKMSKGRRNKSSSGIGSAVPPLNTNKNDQSFMCKFSNSSICGEDVVQVPHRDEFAGSPIVGKPNLCKFSSASVAADEDLTSIPSSGFGYLGSITDGMCYLALCEFSSASAEEDEDITFPERVSLSKNNNSYYLWDHAQEFEEVCET
jgi:hypothetical protein